MVTRVRISIPELFDLIKDAGTKEEKIDILKKNMNPSVSACISILFNPNVVFSLPAGTPPDFKYSGSDSLTLERALKSFPAFVNRENLTSAEKNRLQISWFRLVQNLNVVECAFAFKLKDKEVETGLTQVDLHEAFPTIIPEPFFVNKAPVLPVEPEKEDIIPEVTPEVTPEPEVVPEVKEEPKEEPKEEVTEEDKKPAKATKKPRVKKKAE